MQQVNLYQKEFYQSYDYRRISVAGSFVLLLVIFIVINTYQTYATNQLREELGMKEDNLKQIEQSFAILEIKAKPKAKDMNMAAELEIIKRNNTEKRRALKFLSGSDTGNISGFSLLMQGLGKKRDSIQDLWLKKIKFSRGGYDLHLSGSSYQPELLPKFIQALSEEQMYENREFKEIKIIRSKDNENMIDFILDTQFQTNTTENRTAEKSIELFMAKLNQLSSEKETSD